MGVKRSPAAVDEMGVLGQPRAEGAILSLYLRPACRLLVPLAVLHAYIS